METPDDAEPSTWDLERFWGDTDRVSVMETAIDTTQFQGGAGGDFVLFHPTAGTIPPGTDHISILISQVETASKHAAPKLLYQTAADDAWYGVEDFAMGAPAIIDVGRGQADPPGQGITSWLFKLFYPPTNPDGATYSVSEAHVSITAFKGDALPDFKARAPWTGDRLALFTVEGVASAIYTGDGCSGATGCPSVQRPSEPIPKEARFVEVNVAHSASVTPYLLFHGPWSWDWDQADEVLSSPTQTVFRIPVVDADSAYATKSAWRFEVRNDAPTAFDPFVGAYEIEAYALA